jgi:predicted CXXCH cytochrome family protein
MIVGASLLVFIIALCGCTSSEELTSAEQPPTVAPSPPGDQLNYWQAWQDGPHSDTYDLESGPNTYCAKCHSPSNWDYTSTIDPPPNCVSCKFPSEAHPRLAEGNLLIAQEEWSNIDCSVCHRMENGVADPAYAWHDNVTGYYETMTTPTELCEKCHLDSETLKHKRVLNGDAHVDFVCTECHDAHKMSASCDECHTVSMLELPKFIPEHQDVVTNQDCNDCHNGAYESHSIVVQETGNDDCMDCHERLMGRKGLAPVQIGHSMVHATISCVACHDASNMEAGPLEGQAVWVVYRTTDGPFGPSTEPYQSHQLQLTVECDRCHFPGNSWGIIESADGSFDEEIGDETESAPAASDSS